MIKFEMFNGHHQEELGLIPSMINMFSEDDVATQLDNNYQHGGGFRNQEGFTYSHDDNDSMSYSDDPPMYPIAKFVAGSETVFVYPHAYVAVIQEDETHVISRMD